MSEKPDHQNPQFNTINQVIITILLTSFVAATYGFGFYLFSQLVPDMRSDLGFDYSVVGTITAAGQFGFLVFAFIGAWLSPRIGGGAVVIGSIALCGLCLILLPLSGNILIIGGLLTILGGTAASVYVPMVEIAEKIISYEHRGKVLGLVSSGTSYGVFINSLLVPIFVRNAYWQGVWYSVGIGTLVVTIISFFMFWRFGLFNKESEHTKNSEPEVKKGLKSRIGHVLVPWVLIIWVITFMNGFSTMPFQNYLSPYLREELGFTVDFAAQVWGVIGFIGMFSGFVVGWMSDKTGVKLALLLTYISIFLSSLILVIQPSGQLPLVAGILFAIAFYPIFGLIPAYIAKTAKGAEATIIFGVANITLGIGGMAGNYLAGLQKNLSDTFVWNYVAIAVSSLILCFLSMTLPNENKGKSQSRIEMIKPNPAVVHE